MSVTWEHSEDIVLQTSWAICLTVMPNEDEGEHDKKFVWGGLNNTVSVVGTGATESVKYHGHGAFVAAVSVAPDKKTIASGGGDGLVKIWRDGECVQTLNKHGGSAVAARRGTRAARLHERRRLARARASRTKRRRHRAAPAQVTAVAWHPSSGKLASGGCDRSVIVWSGGGELAVEKKHSEHDDDCNCVAWSPCGEQLASGGDDGVVHVYSQGSALKGKGKKHAVNDCRFSPDSKRIACAYADGVVRVFRVGGGSAQVTLKHGDGPCSCLCWNSHGLWSGGWNKRLTLWNPGKGAQVQSIRAGSKVFSVASTAGDAEICATVKAGKLMIWKPKKAEATSYVKKLMSLLTVDVSQFQ
jgi:WD40 repeat protein